MQKLVRNRASKRIFPILASVLLALLLPLPNAWPIYGGQESIANPIVVGLLRGQYASDSGCSGALVAPQIVFTAAHCLGGPASNFWVATPGSDLRDTTTLRIQVEAFLVPDGFSTSQFPYDNDFGILILKSPFPNAKFVKIATMDQITSWVAQEADVLHVGYGCTALVDSPPCGKTSPIPFQLETQLRKTIPPQFASLKPNTFTVTKISVEKTICGGDSGSPLLKMVEGSWLYIGAQSSSNGAGCTKTCNDLCSATQGLPAANPTLINQIQKYLVPSVPSATPTPQQSPSPISSLITSPSSKRKITITCTKGKITKKITAVNPKCPTGYTKK